MRKDDLDNIIFRELQVKLNLLYDFNEKSSEKELSDYILSKLEHSMYEKQIHERICSGGKIKMFCPSCKQELLKRTKYCPECGQKIRFK